MAYNDKDPAEMTTLELAQAIAAEVRCCPEHDKMCQMLLAQLREAAPAPVAGDAVAKLRNAYDDLRFYVDASENELMDRGITRADALRIARESEIALSALAQDRASQGAAAGASTEPRRYTRDESPDA